MKNFFQKNERYFWGVGILLIVVGRMYPDETPMDNYIAAATYGVTAISFLRVIIFVILNSKMLKFKRSIL